MNAPVTDIPNFLGINFKLHAHRFIRELFPNYLCDDVGPHSTVSESTVSNTELSEFFCPHRAPGRELSEFLSAYYLCAKANSPIFFR